MTFTSVRGQLFRGVRGGHVGFHRMWDHVQAARNIESQGGPAAQFRRTQGFRIHLGRLHGFQNAHTCPNLCQCVAKLTFLFTFIGLCLRTRAGKGGRIRVPHGWAKPSIPPSLRRVRLMSQRPHQGNSFRSDVSYPGVLLSERSHFPTFPRELDPLSISYQGPLVSHFRQHALVVHGTDGRPPALGLTRHIFHVEGADGPQRIRPLQGRIESLTPWSFIQQDIRSSQRQQRLGCT